MSELQSIIEEAFERRADITPRNVETHISDAVTEAVRMLIMAATFLKQGDVDKAAEIMD